MISKALQLMFFWRRNHWPSIAFKSAFWGVVTWFAVGMFTNVRLALIAAAVIAGMSAVKYSLQMRKQALKIMAMCEGDPQKYAALQARLNAPGMAGTLMREMLNAEMDDDDGYTEPLDEEQRAVNITANTKLIHKMATLTRQAGLATDIECSEVVETLLDDHDAGDERLDVAEVIAALLPDNAINVFTEDFINDDDHAALVEEFAAATNERWSVEDCTSSHDDETGEWLVSFKDNGEDKTWRFSQQGDQLSETFLQQLINYTQSRSAYTVTVLDNEETIDLVCLPLGMYDALTENVEEQAA